MAAEEADVDEDLEADVDGQADVDEEDLATPDLDALDPEEREKIASAVAEGDEEEDDQEADTDDTEGSAPGVPDAEDVVDGNISVGHVYCRSLGLGAAAMVNRYDEEADGDMDALVDEYADLAKQTDLDRYMDQWFAEQTGGSSMSPGQGVVVMTLAFVAMVAIQNPAVADGLATEVGV